SPGPWTSSARHRSTTAPGAALVGQGLFGPEREKGADAAASAPFSRRSVRSAGREIRRGRDAAAGVHADRDLLATRSVLEVELAVHDVDLHVVAAVELTVQDALRELVLDLTLHGAAQRPG